MTTILHIAAECFPIAKVGGLADVVGALPKYQNKLGVNSLAIMPYYDNAYTKKNEFKTVYNSSLKLGDVNYNFNIVTPKKNTLGFDIFLIDIPDLLFKDFVYSENDVDRFLAFQIAALDWIISQKELPSLIHCHDHHTGLIPFMMSHSHKYKQLEKTPSVLTIHNAQYQGWFSHDEIYKIPEFDFSKVGLLDWGGTINPLATAIKCAWKVNTVSPSYMEELKLNANGLEGLLSHEGIKCTGILNGVDFNVWNTETDTYLVKNYTLNTAQSGRKANKKWLCNQFGLDVEKPLFAFIGRLVHQKGTDLFPEIFEEALQNNNISILLLGSGDKTVESNLEKLKDKFVGNYNAFIGYDEKLSHIIYAGADFLLMPSRVEPCGLNQMYALRYGSMPIVRKTGGLKDTVIDVSEGGFGFVHNETTVEEVCSTIERATAYYQEQKEFRKNRKSFMQIDHSWDASAQEYIKLYEPLIQ